MSVWFFSIHRDHDTNCCSGNIFPDRAITGTVLRSSYYFLSRVVSFRRLPPGWTASKIRRWGSATKNLQLFAFSSAATVQACCCSCSWFLMQTHRVATGQHINSFSATRPAKPLWSNDLSVSARGPAAVASMAALCRRDYGNPPLSSHVLDNDKCRHCWVEFVLWCWGDLITYTMTAPYSLFFYGGLIT